MQSDSELLSPGEVLDRIPGLKREKLMYWVMKGYITTSVRQRKGRTYHFFSPQHVIKIQQAYRMIVVQGMKDKQAFDRLGPHTQIPLF